MRVNVASFAYFGRFLAAELERLGHLGTLFTNLPASRAGVTRARLVSQPLLAAPYFASTRAGWHTAQRSLAWPTIEVFDRWVAARMTACDLFHCFSSFGRRAHERARREFGAMTVVERGSAHVAEQDELLREEHARWGVPFDGIDHRVVAKEEAEYAECDRITLQSTFAWRSFVARGVPPEKLIKLPLGVDLHLFRRVPKRDTKFRVLYAGTMSLRKGTPYLLEAIAGLNLENWEFAVNGTIAPDVAPMVARHAHRIRFLGTRPFEQLYDVYSQASVLVLPTIEDGFAKVITEAMACGVPVIATTNCSASDVFTDGVEGFIIPIRDARALRDRILQLYEQPSLRTAMAEAAFRRAQSAGGWAAYGERALKEYSAALSRR